VLQVFLDDPNSEDSLDMLYGTYESNFYSLNDKVIVKHKADNNIYNQDWENGNNYTDMWYKQNIYN